MLTLFKRSSFVLLVIMLTGCSAALAVTPVPTETSIPVATPVATADPNDCVGSIIDPPPGLLLESSDDPTMQKTAEPGAGNGGICKGKTFTVVKPVTVYRLWDKSKSWAAYGDWWSLSYPEDTLINYDVENDICPSWGPHNKLSICTLKVGTKVVIGPGQSQQCTTEQILLPQSSVNQVYIPNDTKVTPNQVYVENCESVDWP